MHGKWWVCEVAANISDRRPRDDPYLYLLSVDAAGNTAQGVGGTVLPIYFGEFLTGDRLYGAGGGVDRAIVPFAPLILYIWRLNKGREA
jgi:hypothetical protein